MSLDHFPRSPLLFGPSPVHPLERLTALCGRPDLGRARGLQLWTCLRRQQDSQTRIPGTGGARAGRRHLVSIGGVQSNHTRQVAAVAAKLGLKAVLVQENWVDWPESTVLYAHLGGQPALNAYSALFRS